MKIAVLGGTRFMGPFIVRALLKQGHSVSAYHRGKTAGEFIDGLEHITINRNISGQTADALKKHRPDIIIDMSGLVAEAVKEAIYASESVQQYIFCSSTSVYGKIGPTDIPSETSPINASSPYELGKIGCEQALLKAQKDGRTNVTILRLAHPYGPGEHLVYSTGRDSLFIDRIRQNRSIIITGNGQSRIHPIYVEDVARAFIYVMNRDDCFGNIFNLSGDEILTFDQYFNSIAHQLNCPLNSVHIPPQWFDRNKHLWSNCQRNFNFASVWPVYESAFDVSKLSKTGFKCDTNHDQGVAKTIKWLSERNLIPSSSDNDLEDVIIAAHQP